MTTQTKSADSSLGTGAAKQTKPELGKTSITSNGKTTEAREATVEEKILKVAVLQEKITTRKNILSHLERVEGMKFGEFADRDILSIADGKGATYQIKSPLLMKKVQTVLRDELKAELVKLEAEIQF